MGVAYKVALIFNALTERLGENAPFFILLNTY